MDRDQRNSLDHVLNSATFLAGVGAANWALGEFLPWIRRRWRRRVGAAFRRAVELSARRGYDPGSLARYFQRIGGGRFLSGEVEAIDLYALRSRAFDSEMVNLYFREMRPLKGSYSDPRFLRQVERIVRRSTRGVAWHNLVARLASSVHRLWKWTNIAAGIDIGLTVGRAIAREVGAPRYVPIKARYEVMPASWAGGPAYTHRQRALQAIHNSQLTTRAIFGMEAGYVH